MQNSPPPSFRDAFRTTSPSRLGKPLLGYVAVVVIVAAAFAGRIALSQVFGAGAPMLPFIPAILIGAWIGGFGPGLLATALGALAGAYFFLGSGLSVSTLQTEHVARLALFVMGGVIISGLVGQMHRARRRAETSEARLSAILSELPVGVGLLDRSGRFVLKNRLMERFALSRIPSGDPEQRDRWSLFDAGGKPLEARMWPGARALRGETVNPGVESRYTDDSGEQVWYSIAAVPLRTADDAIDGAVVVMQDIDRIKRAAASLEEADRRKDAFLATLAHELRNPLAPIRNAVELLKLRGPKDPVVDSSKGVIDRQVTHLARLVDDLLDVSRITRNRLELRMEDVTVQYVVEQALEIVRPQIERAGQSLVVSLPDAPVHLHADAIRLAQVITNVLSNASKFSPADGVISLGVETRADIVQIAVEDQGIGIEPGQAAALFEMFAQGPPSSSRAQGGLGIGLWLSRQLMEMHGGSIDAASEGPGKGSRFTITLPVVHRPTSRDEADAPASRVPGGPLRILVVEDNLDGAATLADVLTDQGHAVAVAHDGIEGMVLAGKFRPDVMLLDIGLPKIDGYEVCRLVRRQPWGKAISIVAMTGWGQDADRRKSAVAGFDAHLVKPVDFHALNAVLKRRPAREAVN